MNRTELRHIRWALVFGLTVGGYFGLVLIWEHAQVSWWAPLLWIAAWGVVEFWLYRIDRRLARSRGQ